MTRSCGNATHEHRHPAFSLVELVIVIVIIAIVAAVAVPRAGHAARRARVNTLEATLVSVRTSIDLYYAEHARYPGYDPSSGTPDGDWFVKQLTEYSDQAGKTNPQPTGTYVYGPYLRKPFPISPIDNVATVYVKATAVDPDPHGAYGWIAVLQSGAFGVNATITEIQAFGVEDPNRVSLFLVSVSTASAGTISAGEIGK
jgi:prepilin-type N-terminal cleavage/methylation domain-containing protein